MDKTQGFLDLLPQAEYLEHHLNGLGWYKIIRCKDCKWADWYTVCDGRTYCYCHITDTGGNEEDDFCSSAMRKEE